MELRRYSRRHDEVLKVIGDFIRAYLPPVTVDHPSETYSFHHHITPTNLCPDIMWWCDSQRELWLLELTISYKSIVIISHPSLLYMYILTPQCNEN